MVNVKLYVEGGGDSHKLKSRCREAFHKLLEQAGFTGRMPTIVASGSRGSTYDDFKSAIATCDPDEYIMLLVDSEDLVKGTDYRPDSIDAWAHLCTRDGWVRSGGVAADQAQLMATCMESWIMADHASLAGIFGEKLQQSALFPVENLEL